MVVLVTGADGQLGQAMRSISVEYTEIDFVFCNSLILDICDEVNCQRIFDQYQPNYCINTAAYTAVDLAETEVDRAFEVNERGVKNLAEVCLKFKTILIHISTDFVFDGLNFEPYTEQDQPDPQTTYGKSKLAGERIIENFLKEYYIIRTSWLYSQFGHNFMKTMLRMSENHKEISVINDQIGTPTNANDLAGAIIDMIINTQGNYGIYHYSNEGQCTWYEFAVEIFKVNQIDIRVNPITSLEYSTKANRPKYSVLDKSKIKENFNVVVNSWQSSIPKV